MVEQNEILTRGGVYLARLDPVIAAEVGKVRPIIILNSQSILDIIPPTVFICPLSKRSQLEFSNLHVKLPARDNLQVTSYALVEHCRSITIRRIIYPRLAQLTLAELHLILHRLQRLVGI
ncbi:MAG TPA: type II toxin-antitoxin system PemK/MazF family toxin [Gammaproteobacteria bacterium]|nr:type II toxin-antitoxin system PemK/MazF family toxin [Gammaproteobacteria bacterium]